MSGYPEGARIDSDAIPAHSSFVESLLRHKRLIVLAAIGGGLIAYGLTIPQTRIFRAHTSMVFEGVNDNVMNTRDVDPSATADNSSQAYINTQARILESEPLLERVVTQVKQERFKDATGTALARREKALKVLTVYYLMHTLQIRPTDGTKLVDIYAESADPDVAAAVANSLVTQYVAMAIENRLNSTKLTSGWLSRQLAEARAKLEQSEAALQAYARKSNLLFTGAEDGSVSEARLRQIQEDYSRAQADRAAKESVYEQLKAETPDDKAASLRDTALLDYQMKLSDLNRQLSDLSAVYAPGNEKVRRIQSQIEELKKQYQKEHDSALIRVKNDFDTAQRREDLLAKAFNAQQAIVTGDAAKAVDYNILKREADTDRALYDSMLQKVDSYGIASALQPSNARMVDPAEKPLAPYKPNVPLTTFFGTFAGFTLALVFIGVRGGRTIHVDYPGQTKLILDAPELGVIPSARLDPGLTAPNRIRLSSRNGSEPHAPFLLPKGIETAMWFCRSSLLAESIRSIRTSLLFRQGPTDTRVVVVTSLSPAHGKTSLVSNLGIAMTEVGRRVLMIDADLRCPALHRTFGISGQKGLTNVLDSDAQLEEPALRELIQPTAIPNLDILVSGKSRARPASALFHQRAMAQLISLARNAYDLVLIDTPPLIVSEARIIAPLADGVILVLRAGAVKMQAVSAAEECLRQDGSRVLGTVLNDWDPRSTGYGYYPDGYHKEHYYQAVRR